MAYTATYCKCGVNAVRGTTYLTFSLVGDYTRTWDDNVLTSDFTKDPDAVLAKQVERMIAIIEIERDETTKAAAYTSIAKGDQVVISKTQAELESAKI